MYITLLNVVIELELSLIVIISRPNTRLPFRVCKLSKRNTYVNIHCHFLRPPRRVVNK